MDDFTEEERQQFSIDDDNTADWALKKIRETNAEATRLCNICDAYIAKYRDQKEQIKAKAEQKNTFLISMLERYFGTVKTRETKTTWKYDLLEGSLVYTKPKFTMKQDGDKLLAWLKANNHNEYIKTEETVKWGEFKSTLNCSDAGIVTTADGELVEGVQAEPQNGKFEVKCKEETA